MKVELQEEPTGCLLQRDIKEVETGLAPPSKWNLVLDKQKIQTDPTLQVARVVDILEGYTEPRYMISIRQMAKFIVGKSKKLEAGEIQKGMRVGVDRMKSTSVLRSLSRTALITWFKNLCCNLIS